MARAMGSNSEDIRTMDRTDEVYDIIEFLKDVIDECENTDEVLICFNTDEFKDDCKQLLSVIELATREIH